MADKLTSRQLAQIAVLEGVQAKLAQIHRLIEELSYPGADISVVRRLCRVLDEGKIATSGVGLSNLTQTMGSMAMMARRTGGEQMKLRGLREGLGTLKINLEGALKAARTPVATDAEGPTAAS
ncbi:MAG TPA: hypothetical protein VFU23_14770 [Gemmatimonadales bacterium]|nr:hypothetical protein [Gemmatimonadales bacterium]